MDVVTVLTPYGVMILVGVIAVVHVIGTVITGSIGVVVIGDMVDLIFKVGAVVVATTTVVLSILLAVVTGCGSSDAVADIE